MKYWSGWAHFSLSMLFWVNSSGSYSLVLIPFVCFASKVSSFINLRLLSNRYTMFVFIFSIHLREKIGAASLMSLRKGYFVSLQYSKDVTQVKMKLTTTQLAFAAKSLGDIT